MKKVIIAALTFAPSVAFAQNLGRLDNLLSSVKDLVEAA